MVDVVDAEKGTMGRLMVDCLDEEVSYLGFEEPVGAEQAGEGKIRPFWQRTCAKCSHLKPQGSNAGAWRCWVWCWCRGGVRTVQGEAGEWCPQGSCGSFKHLALCPIEQWSNSERLRVRAECSGLDGFWNPD